MRQKGFTLVELIIVVAIIGILASIALPSYQVYTKKAHVLEGFNLAASAKTAIWDYVTSNGDFPANNSMAGLSNTITGHSVRSIIVLNNIITITYNARVINNATIVLTATNNAGGLSWSCSAGTLNNKYRPNHCRH